MYRYKIVTVGGTWDFLHAGHKALLREAFRVGERVIIGVTSDEFAGGKIENSIESFFGDVRQDVINKRRKNKTASLGENLGKKNLIGRSDSTKFSTPLKKTSLEFSMSGLNNHKQRTEEVKAFLREEGLLGRGEIREIRDIFGPLKYHENTKTQKHKNSKVNQGNLENQGNPGIEAMVVTRETRGNAEKINRWRKENGMGELDIVEVGMVLAEDGEPVSSRRIRAGECDREGVVWRMHKSWGRLPSAMRPRLREPLGEVVANRYEPAGMIFFSSANSARWPFSPYNTPNQVAASSPQTCADFKKYIPCSLLWQFVDRIRNKWNLRNYSRELAMIRGNPFLISVGDVSTKNLLDLGIRPDIVVFDLKVKREKIYRSPKELEIDNGKYKIVKVQNSAGTVSKGLIDSFLQIFTHVRRKLKSNYRIDEDMKRVALWVEGEEDLAVLPAVLFAPLGAVVVYGQPPIRENSHEFSRSRFDSEPETPSRYGAWVRGSRESRYKLQEQGLVVVEVTEEKKKEVFEILRRFER